MRRGVEVAFALAVLVWEVVEEVSFGIAVVIEEGCRLGDLSLNMVVAVVRVEGLIAYVAVGRKGFGLPVSMGCGSALARGAGKSEVYLFWLCVSDIERFSRGHE